jgi:hypothetical protein
VVDTHLIEQIQMSSHKAKPNESSRPVGLDDPEPDFIDIGIGGGLFSGKEATAVVPRYPAGFRRGQQEIP